MSGEKPWYLSKTIWGAFLSTLATVGAMAGMSLDGQTQEDLAQALVQLSGAAGALLAIYGRFTATKRLF